jgi:hypothetical protein
VTAKASADYSTWLKTAKPDGATDRQWEVFKRIMEMEGDPATVMTYDKANVTWGAGFAGLGARDEFKAGPLMLDLLFKSSPEVRAIFWEAGFSFLGQELVVVDADRGWKLRGLDAEIFVRGSHELLSLMINVAQGEFVQSGKATPGAPATPDDRLRKAVLQAQFQAFLKFTFRETDTGDDDVAALKAHARHSGGSNWGEAWKHNDLTSLVRYLYSKDPGLAPSVVPEKWRSLAGK